MGYSPAQVCAKLWRLWPCSRTAWALSGVSTITVCTTLKNFLCSTKPPLIAAVTVGHFVIQTLMESKITLWKTLVVNIFKLP